MTIIPPDFFSKLYFANGSQLAPTQTATLKSIPSDFIVDEVMSVEHTGEGEHIWLHIKKRKMHTDQVAKNLAHLAGIANKDIGVSGMKDFQAETTQWFSVWLPGVVDADLPNWKDLESENCEIVQVVRHNRKLKRGTHTGNQFKILLRDFKAGSDEGIDELFESLERVKIQGVPNYFGEQRFGYLGGNLKQAMDMFASGKRIKQRQKRSMLLSSSRSWLFNCVLSERLREQNWLQVQTFEPLCLEGSRQFFIAENDGNEKERIASGDVHTSGPLYGRGGSKVMKQSSELDDFENKAMQDFDVLKQGLEKAGLEYTRRPLRFIPQNLNWQQGDDGVELSFLLGRGQYATSLIRELIKQVIK